MRVCVVCFYWGDGGGPFCGVCVDSCLAHTTTMIKPGEYRSASHSAGSLETAGSDGAAPLHAPLPPPPPPPGMHGGGNLLLPTGFSQPRLPIPVDANFLPYQGFQHFIGTSNTVRCHACASLCATLSGG